jgi:hypothetical protein
LVAAELGTDPGPGNSEFLTLPGETFLNYLAIFFYGTVSDGEAPDGRPMLEALHEDVRRLHELLRRGA